MAKSPSLAAEATALEADWEDYGPGWQEAWKLIVRRRTMDDSKIAKAHAEDACWHPTKHASYNLEVSPDGYGRLRYLKSKGEGKRQAYIRDGKKAVRTVYPKGGIYLHHLAFIMKGPEPVVCPRLSRRATFRSTDGTVSEDVWLTISHLCGCNACFNPDHLVLEPHAINLSRNSCCAELCAHTNRCKKTAAVQAAYVKSLEDKFYTLV